MSAYWWDHLDPQAWVAYVVVVVTLAVIVGAVAYVVSRERTHHPTGIPDFVTAVKDRWGRVWIREAGESVWGDADGNLRYTDDLSGPIKEMVRRPDL